MWPKLEADDQPDLTQGWGALRVVEEASSRPVTIRAGADICLRGNMSDSLMHRSVRFSDLKSRRIQSGAAHEGRKKLGLDSNRIVLPLRVETDYSAGQGFGSFAIGLEAARAHAIIEDLLDAVQVIGAERLNIGTTWKHRMAVSINLA